MTLLRTLIASGLALALLMALSCNGDGNVVLRFQMAGVSMEPTFEQGQVMNVMGYENMTPQRGEIVVFISPQNESRTFMKRIIGLPGDVIEIDREDNATLLNGEPLNEPYILEETTCFDPCGPWAVPEGSYFVTGDNRRHSSDSRSGWFVPVENIVGWVEK